MSHDTPSYDESLVAFHGAFASELNRSLDHLHLSRTMRVLDAPCGNGFYSRLLAQRLGPKGRLDAVDCCPDYLALTRSRLRRAICERSVQNADVYRLPFEDGAFDLVWCAQSLISLKDELGALREMKRVLRRGGRLAILENDIYHYMLLPWPVPLELPIQRALQDVSQARFGSVTKLAPVRRLPELLANAGLRHFLKHTFVADRTTPWPAKLRKFLECHLRDIARLTRGRLPVVARKMFQQFHDVDHPKSLFSRGAKDLSCLNVLYVATKS